MTSTSLYYLMDDTCIHKKNIKKRSQKDLNAPTKDFKFGNLDHWIELYVLSFCTPSVLVIIGCLNRRWYAAVDHPDLWAHLFESEAIFIPALPNVFHDSTIKIIESRLDSVLKRMRKNIIEPNLSSPGKGREVYVSIMKELTDIGKSVHIRKKKRKSVNARRKQELNAHLCLSSKGSLGLFIMPGVPLLLLPLLIFIVIRLDRIVTWSWAGPLMPLVILSFIPCFRCWCVMYKYAFMVQITAWGPYMIKLTMLTIIGTLFCVVVMLGILRATNIVIWSYSLILSPLLTLFFCGWIFRTYDTHITNEKKVTGMQECALCLPFFVFILLLGFKLDGIITWTWIFLFIPLFILFSAFSCVGTFIACDVIFTQLQEGGYLQEGGLCPVLSIFINCASAQLTLIALKLSETINLSWISVFSPTWITYGLTFNIVMAVLYHRMVRGYWPNIEL